jgi:hypothetical protein
MRFNQLQGSTLVLGVIMAFVASTPSLQQAAYGQATTAAGAIQGTVSDPKGGSLPGAEIMITNADTGAQKILKADSSGFYSVASLVPGIYRVAVTAPGFSKTTTTLTVQIGTTTNGDLKLKLGSATEEVVVSSEALEVNTVQSTVDGVLTAEQIDSLPISGRNFLDLSQLEPGVQLQSGETFDPTKAGYSSISFNGVNGRTARIMLDGQDISDETVGTTTLNVSQGSIEEFQMSRSSLDISNELTSSGAVAVSTRAGSNQFHGQGFGTFRDERSGAAAGPGGSAFPFQRDQMGGRFGGPVLKDKLFAFGSAERIKQDSFNAVQEVPVFSSLNGGYTSPFRDNYYVGRADYNAPLGVHTFFRIAYEDNLDDATYGYGYSRYGNKDNTPAMAGGADFITGKFTHSLRASYLKFHNMIADESTSGVPNPAPGVELFNASVVTGPNLLAPQQTYQSDKQFRYDAGYTFKSHVFQFGVSINRILGGGFASFFGFAPQDEANFSAGPIGTGGSDNAGDPTAYTTAYIVMGNGEGFNTEKSQFNYPAGGQDDWRFGTYFGDTWKVTPKLSVNFGLRYSHDTGRSDSDLAPVPCSDANAAWGTSSPCEQPGATSSSTGNLLDALEPGLGNRINEPNEDFGPKAGFAYDVKGNGKTVVRGGLGLYFENNIFNNVLFDRPARLKSGLFFGDAYLPAGTSSFTFPDGSSLTQFSDGTTLASLWGDAISKSAPYFASLQSQYQAKTKAAGPASNANYVANSLSEGPNGDSLYAPNFRTTRSVQINIGIQREVWKGGIFSGDFIRNVGEHIQQSIDKNLVGSAASLNSTNATNAINATTTSFGCTAGSMSAQIDCAIAAGATITDFAGNGLDSGRAYAGGSPAPTAAFPGINPTFGQMNFNYPLGRSVYNGLQTNLRQSARVPLPGLRTSGFEVSYAFSKFVSSGGADQNFTPASTDNINPLGFVGPAGTDRTHQFSYGGSFTWIGGFTTSIIGHYYSALPTTLTLNTPNGVNGPAEIFSSDLTGDGTTGDILPGYKSGAFMRSIKPGSLASVISNYNATAAGRLTPAGQALVSNGLFTAGQLTALDAVTRTIAAPPTANAGNGNLRTFDLTFGRPIHMRKLGEGTTIEPTFSAFNLFNLSNFGTYSAAQGVLDSTQLAGTPNGTDTSYSGDDGFNRNAMRNGNGSGVFSQGAARVLEYGWKFSF